MGARGIFLKGSQMMRCNKATHVPSFFFIPPTMCTGEAPQSWINSKQSLLGLSIWKVCCCLFSLRYAKESFSEPEVNPCSVCSAKPFELWSIENSLYLFADKWVHCFPHYFLSIGCIYQTQLWDGRWRSICVGLLRSTWVQGKAKRENLEKIVEKDSYYHVENWYPVLKVKELSKLPLDWFNNIKGLHFWDALSSLFLSTSEGICFLQGTREPNFLL